MHNSFTDSLRRINVPRRNDDEFSKRTIHLDTEGFIELAGVRSAAQASGATSAVHVRGKSNRDSRRQIGPLFAFLHDRGRDFMSGNARKGH